MLRARTAEVTILVFAFDEEDAKWQAECELPGEASINDVRLEEGD